MPGGASYLSQRLPARPSFTPKTGTHGGKATDNLVEMVAPREITPGIRNREGTPFGVVPSVSVPSWSRARSLGGRDGCWQRAGRIGRTAASRARSLTGVPAVNLVSRVEHGCPRLVSRRSMCVMRTNTHCAIGMVVAFAATASVHREPGTSLFGIIQRRPRCVSDCSLVFCP
jgi:hypothetical protein